MVPPRRLRGRSRPRLTGLSILVAGLQWDWTEGERDAIRDLITFLEPRRVLTVPYEFEIVSQVLASVIEIRDELTATLQRLPEKSNSAVVVEELRQSCVRFLIAVGHLQWVNPIVTAHLGELRGVFRENLAVLADTFGVKVRGTLGDLLAGRPTPNAD